MLHTPMLFLFVSLDLKTSRTSVDDASFAVKETTIRWLIINRVAWRRETLSD